MTKNNLWLDVLVSLLSVAMIIVSAVWFFMNGTFSISLLADEKLSWHLLRSAGIIAYVLLMISTIWGLFISSQFVKDWSPGPVSLTIHSTISWLSLILGLFHAVLLLFDSYFQYTLADIFVPFIGPYRPEFVGMGTVAFWLLFLIAISFPLQKHLGNRNWKYLHYSSYLAFGLVSLHSLFAGTDANSLGFQLMIGAGLATVLLLLGFRLGRDQIKQATPRQSRGTNS